MNSGQPTPSAAGSPHGQVQLHFIAGMSRAGTRWMSLSLNRHPRVAVFGETLYWGRFYRAPKGGHAYDEGELRAAHDRVIQAAFGMMRNAKSNEYKRLDIADPSRAFAGLLEALPRPATPAAHFRAVAERIAEREGVDTVLEKTPHHVLYLDRIAAAYPDAKFVVMLRDPYGFARSHRHQGDRKPDAVRKSFEALHHPAATAVLWRGYARAIHRAESRFPDRVLVVRFEELTEGPERVIDGVTRFLGLGPWPADVPVAGPRENTSFPGGGAPELPEADRAWMNLVAGREMRALGFPPDGAGPFSLAWMKSVATLPAWARRNLAGFSGRTAGPATAHLRRWLR